MVKRNLNFYERNKETITKTWTLHERKSSYYDFFGWRKRWYYGFLGGKRGLFKRRSLEKRSFLSIYETCII